MRIAFGDLIGGISGDMFVAALIDVGLPLALLKSELKKIPTLRFEIKTAKKPVHSIQARQFRVTCPKREAPRSWKDIRVLIERSKLRPDVKKTGLDIFTHLADAEAKIHGVAADQIHFHEIGATDSIVDIVSAAIGACELGIAGFHFSPIPLGRGMTRSMHGPLPVPAPATLELLRSLPVIGVDIDGETVTPTGAAIIRTLGKKFGAQPSMTIERIGYGAGTKQFPQRPNLFRLILGHENDSMRHEEMLVIETNIDDMNPQLYDHVMEHLLAAGARDVYLAPIQMKKNRPATLLSVICEPRDGDRLAAIIMQETTTIGVRSYAVRRTILRREIKKVSTPYGPINLKIIEQPDGTRRATPEYDDVKRIAAARKLPVQKIYHEVMRSFGK